MVANIYYIQRCLNILYFAEVEAKMIEEWSDYSTKQVYDQVKSVSSFDFRGVLNTSFVSWVYLPEDILLIILDMLNGKDLANVGKL